MQKSTLSIYLFRLVFFIACVFLFSCSSAPVAENKTKNDSLPADHSIWLNHTDTVAYVGKETCRNCHQDIYNSFMKTGMGQSFGLADRKKSAADFKSSLVYDKATDFYYRSYWENDSFRIMEFRLKGRDTVHKLIETVNYIVGSGQHTNSHLQMVNGYVNQAPMTFYTQKQKWDLPPGFEEGHNSRFARKIGLECMSCHNAFPQFVQGSENKFVQLPNGIDCERCHGPGEIHVAKKSAGERIDTALAVDYSIVNPAKLPVARQFDLCMRCHLQGNAVLRPGKSWYDFKPGMTLSDYINVFLPRYKNADDEFIMASHADRLQQSRCFIVSAEKAGKQKNNLRPYKNALTCVTCHNPHLSVKETSVQHFNSACANCHGPAKNKECSADKKKQEAKQFNCVSCHMPGSGSTDIPHVSIHDHYIRKPMSVQEVKKIKEFAGLFAVNNANPDALTMARAYLNQYDKFEWKLQYLDSADVYLNKCDKASAFYFESKVHLYFIRKQFSDIVAFVKSAGQEKLLKEKLIHKTLDNNDAWTAYRIGEAFKESGNAADAEKFLARSCELSPYNPEFLNKLAAALLLNGKKAEARQTFMKALIENPRYVPALTNLGYLDVLEGDVFSAEKNYRKGLALDPDYEPLLLNVAGLSIAKGEEETGIKKLEEICSKKNHSQKAEEAMISLASYKASQGNKSAALSIIRRLQAKVPQSIAAKELLKKINSLNNGKGK